MKLGDDGISTVPVYEFYERLDASGLIDVIADVLVLAEIHSAVGHTMTFFQYPHLFGREWTDRPAPAGTSPTDAARSRRPTC